MLALTGALLLYMKKPSAERTAGRGVPLWRQSVEQDIQALARVSGGGAKL